MFEQMQEEGKKRVEKIVQDFEVKENKLKEILKKNIITIREKEEIIKVLGDKIKEIEVVCSDNKKKTEYCRILEIVERKETTDKNI